MERVMGWVGACVNVAWWDGSCLGLRLHRLGDLIDHVAAGPHRQASGKILEWPATREPARTR